MPRLRRSRTRFWHPKRGRHQARVRETYPQVTEPADTVGYNLDKNSSQSATLDDQLTDTVDTQSSLYMISHCMGSLPTGRSFKSHEGSTRNIQESDEAWQAHHLTRNAVSPSKSNDLKQQSSQSSSHVKKLSDESATDNFPGSRIMYSMLDFPGSVPNTITLASSLKTSPVTSDEERLGEWPPEVNFESTEESTFAPKLCGYATGENSLSSSEAGGTGFVDTETPSLQEPVKIWIECPDAKELLLQDFAVSGDDTGMFPQVHRLIKGDLPKSWDCLPCGDGFNLVLFCQDKQLAVQRQIFVGYDGTVEISVHRKPLKEELLKEILGAVPRSVSLTDATWEHYCERAVALARRVHSFEVCCGVDNMKYRDLWKSSETGDFDKNPYGELKYTETCRSKSCSFLINSKRWRCHDCFKLKESFRKKRSTHQGSGYSPHTANIHLDESQKLSKLKDQHDEIRAQQKMIERMSKKINESLEKGVNVVNEMHTSSKDVSETAKPPPGSASDKLAPSQKHFRQELVKVSKVKRGKRC